MQAAKSRDCCRGSFPLLPHAVALALFSTRLHPLQELGRLQDAETLGSMEAREPETGQAVGKDGACLFVQRKCITLDNTPVLLQIPFPL